MSNRTLAKYNAVVAATAAAAVLAVHGLFRSSVQPLSLGGIVLGTLIGTNIGRSARSTNRSIEEEMVTLDVGAFAGFLTMVFAAVSYVLYLTVVDGMSPDPMLVFLPGIGTAAFLIAAVAVQLRRRLDG